MVAIVCIGSAFGVSSLIENSQKNNTGDIPFVYPENAPVTIDGDKYLTTIGNGGYTYEKLKELLSDPTTPTHDDRYLDLKITEYNDLVVLSYERVLAGEPFNLNVIFDKIDDKFAFTGCMNFKINQSGILWWTKYSFENKMWLGDNFSPLKNKLGTENGLSYTFIFDESKIVEPRYYSKTHSVSVAQLQGASKWTAWTYFGNEVYQCAIKGCYDILQDYFVSFSPFNIMTHDSKVETDLNAFYTAVIKQAQIAGDNAIIDVSGDTVVIDSNSQVYKGKNYIKVDYIKFDTNAYETKPADKGVQEIKDKTLGGASKDFEVKPEIQILCKNTNGFDVDKIPEAYLDTVIQLTNKETGEVHQYPFNNIDSLKNGRFDNLSYGKYEYVVVSKYFDFKTNQGEFEIRKGDSQFIFEYEYTSDIVDLTIKFENAGDTIEDFDITAQPVSIKLKNKTDNTETTFVFNTQESFENGMKKPVEIGSYTLTIISEGLRFINEPATIDVTIDQHELVFTYKIYNERNVTVRFTTTDLSETEQQALGSELLQKRQDIDITFVTETSSKNSQIFCVEFGSNMFQRIFNLCKIETGTYSVVINCENETINFGQIPKIEIKPDKNNKNFYFDILISKKESDHEMIMSEDGLSKTHLDIQTQIADKNHYLLCFDYGYKKISLDDDIYPSTINMVDGQFYYYIIEHGEYIDAIGFQYKKGTAYKITIK